MSFWNELKERLEQIKTAKAKMYEPKIKDTRDVVKIDAPSAPLPHKMEPEELQDFMKANRGTGYHKNPKDKRTKNPKKNQEDW